MMLLFLIPPLLLISLLFLMLHGLIPCPRIFKGRLMMMLLLFIFYISDYIPDGLYASRNSTLDCAFFLVVTDFLGHVVLIVSGTGHEVNSAARAAIGGTLFLVADEVGDTFGENAVEPGLSLGGCYDDGSLDSIESDTE